MGGSQKLRVRSWATAKAAQVRTVTKVGSWKILKFRKI